MRALRTIARITLLCVVGMTMFGMALPVARSDEVPHPRETVHYIVQPYPFQDCGGRIEAGFHGPPVAHYGQCEVQP